MFGFGVTSIKMPTVNDVLQEYAGLNINDGQRYVTRPVSVSEVVSDRPVKRKASCVKRAMRSRNWCFTDNSCGDDFNKDCAEIRYGKRQLEEAPSTGKQHYQGWLQLDSQQSLTWMKSHVSATCHWEACKGSEEANEAYCSKLKSQVGQPEVWPLGARGELPIYKKQGCASTFHEAADLLSDGKTDEEMCQLAPSLALQHGNKFEPFRRMLKGLTGPPKPRKDPVIFFLIAPSGAGKTEWLDRNMGSYYSAKDFRDEWMTGYSGEDTIVFDEFECNYPLQSMLQLLSKGPCSLRIHNGYLPCRAHKFVFASYRYMNAFQMYSGDEAWVTRVNRYGTIVNFPKVVRVGWRQAPTIMSTDDITMLCAEGKSTEGTLLSKGVAPNPSITLDSLGSLGHRGAIALGASKSTHMEVIPAGLKPHVGLSAEWLTEPMDQNDTKEVLPCNPPPLVRQMAVSVKAPVPPNSPVDQKEVLSGVSANFGRRGALSAVDVLKAAYPREHTIFDVPEEGNVSSDELDVTDDVDCDDVVEDDMYASD